MTDRTYDTESLHTPESRERDARLVGHEPKGNAITDRVDLDAVRAQVMTVQTGGNVYVFADDYAALLAERDFQTERLRIAIERAEKAEDENQKLREANARWYNNSVDTWQAMVTMRNDINEYVPLPSIEADLLKGPENSVFLATVAECVCAALAEQEKTDDQ